MDHGWHWTTGMGCMVPDIRGRSQAFMEGIDLGREVRSINRIHHFCSCLLHLFFAFPMNQHPEILLTQLSCYFTAFWITAVVLLVELSY